MLKRLGTAATVLFLPLAGHAQVVISQVYGGGGNSGSVYKNDFVELYNRGTTAVDLAGYTIQYASAASGTFSTTPPTGTGTPFYTTLSGTIQPGQYFLVQEAAGAAGTTNLPTPDVTGAIAISGTAGRVALVSSNTPIAFPADALDFVGWNTTAIQREGGTTASNAPATNNTTSILRKNNGCQDTNINSADFAVSTGAIVARNSATAATSTCNLGATNTALTITNGTFTSTIAGQSSTSADFTLTNSGATAQTVTLNSSAPFGYIGTNPITVPAAASGVSGMATFTLKFSPPSAGTYTGTVVAAVAGFSNVTSSSFSGTSTAVTNSALTIANGTFPSTVGGTTSTSTNFTLSNSGATSQSVTLSANSAFSYTGTNPVTVPATGTATFTLKFSPSASSNGTISGIVTAAVPGFSNVTSSFTATATASMATLTDATTSTLRVGVPSVILITGTNFITTAGATTVNYSGGTVSNVTVSSTTSLRATLTPTSAVSGTMSVTTAGGTSNPLSMVSTAPPAGFFEPFESVYLNSYLTTSTVLALSSGDVTANGILLTVSTLPSTEKRNNSQSARLRPSGYVEFSRPNGVGTVTLQAAVFGAQSATSPSFTISYSIDDINFFPVDGTPADGGLTATLSSYSYTVNVNGPVYLRISNTAVYTTSNSPQVNIDDVQLTNFNATSVTWTGAVSTDWTNFRNWEPKAVPTGLINVTITNLANQPLVSGIQTARNVTVQAGASLTLAGGTMPGLLTLGTTGIVGSLTLASGSTFTQRAASEIYISGDLTNNGATFVLDPTSEVGFGITGVPAHLLSGTAGVDFQTLTVGEKGANDVLTLKVPVRVRRKLGMYHSSITNLVAGGSLTLVSDDSGTALIENGDANSFVDGTTTVQRFLNPSTFAAESYRHQSSPVTGATVASFDNTATNGTFSPQISKASEYNASATPGTVTPFPTVYGYDQTRVMLNNTYTPFDRGFVVPLNMTTPLVVGQGYAVHRSAGEVVNFTGTPTTGTHSLNLVRNASTSDNATDAGWQLVGNPYPSPLDYSLVIPTDRANLDAAIYVLESSGAYSGTYRANVNGVGGNTNSPNSLIGTGQGFFVRVSAGSTSGTLTFRNSQRVTNAATQVAVYRGTADARPLVQLALRGTSGQADVFTAYAEAGTTPGFDTQYDAAKLPNPSGLNLASLATTGQALAIDGRPAFSATTVLSLNVGVPAAGTYSLTAAALHNLPAGLDAFLTDAATGQTVPLGPLSAYSFTVTNGQAAATMTRRFSLHFGARTALATAPALSAAAVTLYPNPARGSFTLLLPAMGQQLAVRAALVNALGQTVLTRTIALTAAGATAEFNTQALAPGVYTLHLVGESQSLSKRVVIE